MISFVLFCFFFFKKKLNFTFFLRDILTKSNFKPKTKKVFGDDNENISGDEAVQRQLALLEKWWCGSAKFHAQFWQRHLQLAKEYPYLRGADWVFGNGRLRWQQSLEASKRHWKTALKRTDLSLDQRLVTLIDRALAGSSWHVFQQRLNSAPITITHGDFHASNMFVQLVSYHNN